MYRRSDAGYLIIYVVILMFITMMVGLSVVSLITTRYAISNNSSYRKNSEYAARACLNATVQKLQEESSFTGFTTEQVVFDRLSANEGKATCKSQVSDGAQDTEKVVEISAKTIRYTGDSGFSYKARITLLSNEADTDLSYLDGGVLVGGGGMQLAEWGLISAPQINSIGWMIPASNKRMGDILNIQTVVDSPKINVGNKACGTAATWPSNCTGNQPFSSNTSVLRIGYVSGKTCAPAQTTDSDRFINTGLATNCKFPDIQLPRYDKKAFIDKVKSKNKTINPSVITSEGGCWRDEPIKVFGVIIGHNYYGQTYTIPADTKIDGDLKLNNVRQLNSGQVCKIVFQGDTYIKGAIKETPGSPVQFSVSSSKDIDIVVNGKLSFHNNVSFPIASNGSLAHFIGFYTTNNASCSNSETVPNDQVATCLTRAQAQTDASVPYRMTNSSNLYSTGVDFYGDRESVRDFKGATIYSYYSIFNGGYSSKELKIAGIAAPGLYTGSPDAQIIGFLNNYYELYITSNAPTFGQYIAPEIGVHTYKIIDYALLQ